MEKKVRVYVNDHPYDVYFVGKELKGVDVVMEEGHPMAPYDSLDQESVEAVMWASLIAFGM